MFHERFNSEDWYEISRETDTAFKNVSTESSFAEYLMAAKCKLGTVKKTKGIWRVDKFFTGTFVSLEYNTESSEGNAVEDFVFVIAEDKSTLYRYDISFPTI